MIDALGLGAVFLELAAALYFLAVFSCRHIDQPRRILAALIAASAAGAAFLPPGGVGQALAEVALDLALAAMLAGFAERMRRRG